jgi:hypothetical protein
MGASTAGIAPFSSVAYHCWHQTALQGGSMKNSALFLSALILALPVVASAGSETITIPKKVAFKKGINVPAAVRKECNLETESASIIGKVLSDEGYKVVQADHVSRNTRGKALELGISRLFATGGPFAPKQLEINGVLHDNGKLAGSFLDIRRTSGFGPTCARLVYDARAIGKDIAQWLKHPKPDSRLGDAK